MLAAILLAAAPQLFQAYAPDSLVAFRVPFLKFNVIEGRFNRFGAAISYNETLMNSSVSARIESASLDSGFETRDKDLKSASFFEVEKYPEITFHSTRVSKNALEGELTMHGVTRPVSLKLEVTGVYRNDPERERIGFLARGTLSRKAFGIGHGATAETISDEVEIELRISAQRQTWATIPAMFYGDQSLKNAAAAAVAAGSAAPALAKMRELRGAAGYDGSVDQYIMLGAHFDTKGDAAGAAIVFEACVEAFPQDARCKVRLALEYEAAGQLDKARAEVKRLLQSDPGNLAGAELLRRIG